MVVDDDFASFVDIISFNQYYGWYGDRLKISKTSIGKSELISLSLFQNLVQEHYKDIMEMSKLFGSLQNALYRETLPTLMRIPQISEFLHGF